MWEQQPDLPERWPTIIVFAGKPDGPGVRPIALTCSLRRVWARLRQGLARDWNGPAPSRASGASRAKRASKQAGNTLRRSV
eukprot:9490285-Pyramimonas_sp.AAC.1